MSDLIQSVTNGTITPSASTSGTTSSNALGKDAFLQLLVTQMKYQDPLKPNDDTQFVAQLATFSQLEQMQNLSQTSTNSQAFGLVGMNVVVSTTNSSGNTSYTSGTVDSVVMSNGVAKLSIGGSLYTMDQVCEVIDTSYIIMQGLPSVETPVSLNFDKFDGTDLSFEVNVGSGDTIANDIAVIIDGTLIDSEYVTLNGTTVTINKEGLSEVNVGNHNVTLVFNDAYYTTVSGKVTIKVTDSNPNPEPEVDPEVDPEDDITDPVDPTDPVE